MSSSGLQRFILFLLITPLILVTSPSRAEYTNDFHSLTPIAVQLKWKHQFQFAGFYAAVEKGFYQEAGFNVTLKEAGPMINPIDEVLSGRADYGVANSELVLYRMNGEPVTVLAL